MPTDLTLLLRVEEKAIAVGKPAFYRSWGTT